MRDKTYDMHNGYIRHRNGQAIKENGTAEDDDFSDNSSSSSGSSSSDSSKNNVDVVKACRKLQRARSIPAQIGIPRLNRYLHGAIHGDWSRKRKLIIHFDIRNTILVADSVTNVTVEEALNSFLTGVVWGSEKDGQWVWHSTIPSLKAPAPGVITYYKYLEKRLVKNPTDRVNLRLQTGDFAHTPLGKCFQTHFDTHLKRLSWHEDLGCHRDKVLTMSGRDGKPYHYILPSFYKLLKHLKEKNRDFAIIIRTYGRDAPNVLSSINYGVHGHHPYVGESLNIKLHKIPGLIKRDAHSFELKTFKQRVGSDVNQMLTHDRDIYRFLCSSQGITGYVDDFLYWQKNNYDHAAGKPLWIDPDDRRHHHIFFDDNFRADDEDSIIDVRMFSKENPAVAKSLGHSEVARLENTCLVQADLLESIADEDYFIRMTNVCEEKYEQMLRSGEL